MFVKQVFLHGNILPRMLTLFLCEMPNAAEGEVCLLVTLHNPTLTQEHCEERIQEITATLTAPG